MLLATVIGGMILAGLYVVMNMTVSQTLDSRERIDAEDVSRAVFNKVSLDLSSVLGPAPPKSGGKPANGATISTSGATDTGTTDGTTDTGMTDTGMTGTGMTDTGMMTDPGTQPTTDAATTDTTAAEGDETAGAQNIPFQVGVIGTGTQLTIFASRVPDVLGTPGALNSGTGGDRQQSSDLVRIDYWKGAGGLCRQERVWVTADQTGNNFSFDLSNEAGSVIAEEATDVLFEYFDGTDWVDTWEGGGNTIPAPPVAVRVTLTFSRTGSRGEPITRTISQVIAVRVAPGTAAPELVDPVVPSGNAPATEGTDSGTTGGGTSGGTTTGGGASTAGGTSGTGTGGTTGGGTTGGRTTGGGGTTGGGTTGKGGGTTGGKK